MVAGATADILVINGLNHLAQAGALAAGDTLGVLSDGWAPRRTGCWARVVGQNNDVTPEPGRGDRTDPSAWGGDRVVLALADAATVEPLVAGSPSGLAVLSLLDAFDPANWSGSEGQAAAARLYVATPAPAYGSDYPAAVAVSSMAAATGAADTGPRTLDGLRGGCDLGPADRPGLRRPHADPRGHPAGDDRHRPGAGHLVVRSQRSRPGGAVGPARDPGVVDLGGGSGRAQPPAVAGRAGVGTGDRGLRALTAAPGCFRCGSG